MAKFQFRLQTLLRMREAERDHRREDLAKAFEADQILVNQIQQLDEQIENNKNNYRDASQPGLLNIEQLIDAQRQDLLIVAEKQAIIQQRATLEPEIQRRRLALVEADRNVRVIEKLREQHLQQHKEESAKQETKQLDEIASRVHPESEDQSWAI